MSATGKTTLCSYLYDALDRLVGGAACQQQSVQRFYLKNHLVTETHGLYQCSIFQQGDHLLGQQRHQGGLLQTVLLATDQQRSVLHALEKSLSQSTAYTPYGHRQSEGGLLSLLGFNGERRDPLTGHYLLGNGYRAFNPVLMRFNSPDSWSPFGDGGLNAYAYCEGDPVSRRDPTGHAISLKQLIMFREANPATPLGTLNKFVPTPHILEKIAGYLPGDDLVSFALASRATKKVADAIQPSVEKITALTNQQLIDTALGRMPGYYPSKVLGNDELWSRATINSKSDSAFDDMFKRNITYNRSARARAVRAGWDGDFWENPPGTAPNFADRFFMLFRR